jgi:Ca2+/H+ antiporter, TMEM165/GDT1 family
VSWSVFLSAFGLIFIAELGDKTQLAVLVQTCKYRRPLPVFLGGSIALIVATALGVIGGQILSYLVPESIIRIVAAVIFVLMGGLVWRESMKSGASKTVEATDCAGDDDATIIVSQPGIWDWRAFGSTLALLFFAELGDKTQLAVLSLTSESAQPWAVFAGAASALTLVTAIGVLCGQQLSRLIPERQLLRISAAAFVVLGILMGLGVL